MRKLKLDVDSLHVESFEALPSAADGGTVLGQDLNRDEGSIDCDGGGWGSFFGTCEGCPTVGTCIGPTFCCAPTWKDTCNPSCNITCHEWDCPP
jgi:hypothetical protein